MRVYRHKNRYADSEAGYVEVGESVFEEFLANIYEQEAKSLREKIARREAIEDVREADRLARVPEAKVIRPKRRKK